jgi:hypothetical protein
MNAFILLIIVAVVIVSLYWVSNRKTFNRVNEAKQRIQKRILALEDRSIDLFLEQCSLVKEYEHGARILLSELADMLKVPPEKLARDLCIDELLVFTFDTGGEEDQQQVDPYSYELIERITSRTDKLIWERRWKDNPDLPRNEDGLAEFISRMTISEFLLFFSPLVNR